MVCAVKMVSVKELHLSYGFGFLFLTVSLELHEHVEFDGRGLCGTNLRQDGRLTLSQKKKCPSTSLFVSDYESVNP